MTPAPIEHWDLGLLDGSGLLDPVGSVVQQDPGQHPYTFDASNTDQNPQVVSSYDVSVSLRHLAAEPVVRRRDAGRGAGPDRSTSADYHLSDCPTSPACNLGLASSGGVNSPALDIDDEVRPALGGIDAGSDEFGSAAPAPGPQQDVLLLDRRQRQPAGPAPTADDADVYRGATGRSAGVRPSRRRARARPERRRLRPDRRRPHSTCRSPGRDPGPGSPNHGVTNEDVVTSNGTWSLWFDGAAHGLRHTDQRRRDHRHGDDAVLLSLTPRRLPAPVGRPAWATSI